MKEVKEMRGKTDTYEGGCAEVRMNQNKRGTITENGSQLRQVKSSDIAPESKRSLQADRQRS